LDARSNYQIYDEIHVKNYTSQGSNPPKVLQKANFADILNVWTWNANCLYELEMEFTKFLQLPRDRCGNPHKTQYIMHIDD